MMLLDLIGTVLSFIATYYFIYMNNKAWMISVVAIVFNAYLYGQQGIYADMMLECFYLLFSIYGWVLWQPKQHIIEQKKITMTLCWHQWILLTLAILVMWYLIELLLINVTDSTIATLDALTAALSIAAQGLLAHRIIITWFFWLIADGIYSYLYFSKHLFFHGALMIVYIGFALMGYNNWKKQAHLKIDGLLLVPKV